MAIKDRVYAGSTFVILAAACTAGYEHWGKKMAVLKHILPVVCLAVFVTLILGCSSSPRTDYYVSLDNPDDVLELSTDGTFYSEEGGVGCQHEWDRLLMERIG